jgi:endonuclease/exonuclease/phosphatase (EEP) superfamily protein YafD
MDQAVRTALWAALAAPGIVACSATLFGFLGKFSWFLDLFSHFRVQYLLGLAVITVPFLVVRRWRTAAVFLVFAAINLLVILPLYTGSPATPPESQNTLRAMLINVKTHQGDPERVRNAVQEADPDILVLAEISTRWVRDMSWLGASHPHASIEPRDDNFGIGLFSKLPLAEDAIVYIGDANVPSIIATIETGHGAIRIVATHPLPPGGAKYSRMRNDQLDKLPDHLRSSLPVILLGDLNVTPWNYHFQRLRKRAGLLDSSRGFGFQPTWPSHNRLLSIPLDHCLHSPDIRIVHREVGQHVGSDHYPLIVDFVVDSTDY